MIIKKGKIKVLSPEVKTLIDIGFPAYYGFKSNLI